MPRSKKFGLNDRSLIGFIVAAHGLNNDQVTAWEEGRQASLDRGALADNPYPADSIAHDEWARGFVHGSVYDARTGDVEEIVLTGVGEIPPLMEVSHVPERTFWAVANNYQRDRLCTVEQLAAYVGLPVDRVNAGMISHGFFDDDAISLGIRAAV